MFGAVGKAAWWILPVANPTVVLTSFLPAYLSVGAQYRNKSILKEEEKEHVQMGETDDFWWFVSWARLDHASYPILTFRTMFPHFRHLQWGHIGECNIQTQRRWMKGRAQKSNVHNFPNIVCFQHTAVLGPRPSSHFRDVKEACCYEAADAFVTLVDWWYIEKEMEEPFWYQNMGFLVSGDPERTCYTETEGVFVNFNVSSWYHSSLWNSLVMTA